MVGLFRWTSSHGIRNPDILGVSNLLLGSSAVPLHTVNGNDFSREDPVVIVGGQTVGSHQAESWLVVRGFQMVDLP